MGELRAREERVGKLVDNLMKEVVNNTVEASADVAGAKANAVGLMERHRAMLAWDQLEPG